jgi:hypothetical protein
MESPVDSTNNWAISTYLRFKPTFLPKAKDIEYKIQGL